MVSYSTMNCPWGDTNRGVNAAYFSTPPLVAPLLLALVVAFTCHIKLKASRSQIKAIDQLVNVTPTLFVGDLGIYS